MATKIYLLSEDRLKTDLNLNNNTDVGYIATAILNAQEIGLRSILGECLYNAILSMVSDGSITGDTCTHYKYLLDNYIIPYLEYETTVYLLPNIEVKLDSIGSVRNNDEHTEHLSQKDFDLLVSHYQDICDSYRHFLQLYLRANGDLFPELTDCSCGAIKPNLDSSESSPVFLGGFRGRILRHDDCCR